MLFGHTTGTSFGDPMPAPAALLAAQERTRRGLVAAVETGDEAGVAAFLNAGASARTMTAEHSVLAEAIARGHLGVARLLLDAGADPMARRQPKGAREPAPHAWDRAVEASARSMEAYILLKERTPSVGAPSADYDGADGAWHPWPSLASIAPWADLIREFRSCASPVPPLLFEQTLAALLARPDAADTGAAGPVSVLWDAFHRHLSPRERSSAPLTKILKAVHKSKNEALFEWALEKVVDHPHMEFHSTFGDMDVCTALVMAVNNGWDGALRHWLWKRPRYWSSMYDEGAIWERGPRHAASNERVLMLLGRVFLRSSPQQFEGLWGAIQGAGWKVKPGALALVRPATRVHRPVAPNAAFQVLDECDGSGVLQSGMELPEVLAWLQTLLRIGVPANAITQDKENLGHRFARSLPLAGDPAWMGILKGTAKKVADTLSRHKVDWTACDKEGVSALERMRRVMPDWVARRESNALRKTLKASGVVAPSGARRRL